MTLIYYGIFFRVFLNFEVDNYDNENPDDEPNIVQMSSYYDYDSLNTLFKDKGN